MMDLSTFVVLNSLLVGITFLLAFADSFLGGEGELQIKVNQDKTLRVASGGTLLDALAEKEIYLPSACGGKGTCGHCKVKIHSGAGNILPTEEGLLSTAEKRSGVRISCQIRLKEDLEISVPEGLLEVEEYEAEIVDLVDMNGLDRRVRMKLVTPAKIDFQAGQYIQVMIPGYEEFRAYSIASNAEHNEYLELMVRRVPNGLSTTYIHRALKIGDRVTLTGPYGDELAVAADVEKAVMVAGGIGIAPFASLVEDLVFRDTIKEAKLIYGVNQENQFITDERFTKLATENDKFEYIKVVAFDDNWQGEKGFVTDVLKKMDLDGYKIYMCGPPPMINAALGVLNNLDVPAENIYYETQ